MRLFGGHAHLKMGARRCETQRALRAKKENCYVGTRVSLGTFFLHMLKYKKNTIIRTNKVSNNSDLQERLINLASTHCLCAYEHMTFLLFSCVLFLSPVKVGAPIHVKRAVPNPSQQQLNRLHKKYVQGLVNLFEEQKHRYGLPRSVKLTIV